MKAGKVVDGIAFAVHTILRVALAAALAIVLIVAASQAYHIGYSVFTVKTMDEAPGRDVVVTIAEGQSAGEVGRLLESKGLISDDLIYRIQSIVYEYSPLPGTYLLNTSQTIDEMMEIMTTPASESSDGSGAAK